MKKKTISSQKQILKSQFLNLSIPSGPIKMRVLPIKINTEKYELKCTNYVAKTFLFFTHAKFLFATTKKQFLSDK